MEKKLIIEEKFAKLLPPCDTDQEFEADLLRYGIREPLWVLPGDRLINGHRRYRIAMQHGLPFQVRVFAGISDDEAIEMVYSEQITRRNLSARQRSALAIGKLYNQMVQRRKSKRETGSSEPDLEWDGEAYLGPEKEPETGRISTNIGKMAGIGEKSVREYGKVAKLFDRVPEEIQRAYVAGRLKVSRRDLRSLVKLSKKAQKEVVAQIPKTWEVDKNGKPRGKPLLLRDLVPKRRSRATPREKMNRILRELRNVLAQIDQYVENYGSLQPYTNDAIEELKGGHVSLSKWRDHIK